MNPSNELTRPEAENPVEGALPPRPLELEDPLLRQELATRYDLDPSAEWSAKERLAQIVQGEWSKIENPQADTHEKFGANRRVVVLISDNPNKLSEFKRNFALYGIEVFQVPAIEHPDYREALLRCGKEGVKIVSLLREESNLYHHGTKELARIGDLERVDNVSKLRAFKNGKSGPEVAEYKHTTEGYVDLSKRPGGLEQPEVFGWDDVFVLRSTGHTYEELRKRGYKVSSRDMAISQFIKDNIYYPQRVNLRFNPREQNRPVDFGCSVSDFIRSNPHLMNGAAKTSGVANLFRAVVNEGVFFRAPENRREKNYWLPGLNAGIPFVPKKDAIHEITYMAHDFGHFLIPDLIFTGKATDANRRTYIAYRMISEAVTLVLADMLFVDTLKRSGHEYDFAKRKIYPIFQELKIDLSNRENLLDNLRDILACNVRYCLKGDDSGYRERISANGGNLAALEQFKEKYMPFFVEDFRWTERNWRNMTNHAARFERWWLQAAALRDEGALALETIEEFHAALDPEKDLVDQVFERVWNTRIAPNFGKDVELVSKEEQQGRAFFRYMSGQIGLFSEFDFVPEAARYSNKIKERLVESGPSMSLEEIDRVRGFYEQFVDILRDKNLISLDDSATYKEVYPLYPPFFVFYDEGAGFYEDLAAISKRILTPSRGVL